MTEVSGGIWWVVAACLLAGSSPAMQPLVKIGVAGVSSVVVNVSAERLATRRMLPLDTFSTSGSRASALSRGEFQISGWVLRRWMRLR